MNLSQFYAQYKSHFNLDPSLYFSPGRVNLIGEHIDYLGGRVFPTAIQLGIYALAAKREDQLFTFQSHNFPAAKSVIVPMDELSYRKKRGWANYPVGMIDAFVSKGLLIDNGLDIVVFGDLPNGAGLSSSAAMEILMGIILKDQYDFAISKIDMVQIAKEVENNYVGVNCGIMDQFAVAMSQKHHAIYLDTNTLEYELVPLPLQDHVLLIANSNVKRGLVDSKYNERRQECETGLNIIQTYYPNISALCQVSMEQFNTLTTVFPNESIKRRVRHAITEHKRTQDAVSALKVNNLAIFGKILNEGHASLKDDFEVSTAELDILQETLLIHGAIGARMTGAGFGGCVVALVKPDNVEELITQVQQSYTQQTTKETDIYLCVTSDGAHKLNKEDVL